MSGEEPKPAEDNSGASLFLAPDRGDRQIPGVPRRPHFILGGELTTIRREKTSRGNDGGCLRRHQGEDDRWNPASVQALTRGPARSADMQTIFGFIIGVAVTIGVAYVHDASITAPSLDANASATERQMVNWDVVGSNWRELKTNVTNGWHKLQRVG
jgi:hypothetical protein